MKNCPIVQQESLQYACTADHPCSSLCVCACACAWHQVHSVGETPHHKYVFCRQTSKMGNIIRFCRVVLFCSHSSYYMVDLLVPFFYSIVFWVGHASLPSGNVEFVLLIAWLQVHFGINSTSNCMRCNRVLLLQLRVLLMTKLHKHPCYYLLSLCPPDPLCFSCIDGMP